MPPKKRAAAAAPPTPALTERQIAALKNAHSRLDAAAALTPGRNETAEQREARKLRSDLEDAFGPETFAPAPEIATP